MNVDVAVTHYAKVCVKPKLNAERMTFDAVVSVEVREASAKEAPVALRYKAWSSDDRAVELRWLDGSLYGPSSAEGRGGGQQSLGDLVARSAQVDGYGGIAGSGNTHGTTRGRLADLANVRRVESDGLPEKEAAVRAAAADLLVVDGLVWHRVQEPALKVGREGRDAFLHVEEHPSIQKCFRSLYRFDEMDVLRDSLSRRVTLHPTTIEVLVPEALNARFAELALVEWAESRLGWMEGRLKDMDRAYFDAFATLRDALPAAKAALEVDPLEGVEDMRALADAGEAAEMLEHVRLKASDSHYEGKVADLAAVERFRRFAPADEHAALAM